jgi:hypothetical protein
MFKVISTFINLSKGKRNQIMIKERLPIKRITKRIIKTFDVGNKSSIIAHINEKRGG